MTKQKERPYHEEEVWVNPHTGQDYDEIGREGGPHITVIRRVYDPVPTFRERVYSAFKNLVTKLTSPK